MQTGRQHTNENFGTAHDFNRLDRVTVITVNIPADDNSRRNQFSKN